MTSSPYDRVAGMARRIVDARPFRATIVAVILFAGVLAGVETNAAVVAQHRALLMGLDAAVLTVFIVEILLKLAAHGRRPLDYFRDGWNVFDFTIVVVCILPVGGPFATVLRLVRTLRLLRLVSALPKLQLLVGALLKSLSAMGYVSLLLALIFYIYAVAGIHLFGRHAPEQFGTLPIALLSLFQMITLDAWSELFHAACAAAPFAATVYFVSFILLGTMIMLNLFIGVIMSSMSEMHAELEENERERNRIHRPTPLHTHFSEVERHLGELRRALLAKHPGSIPEHTSNGAVEDSLRSSPTGVVPENASKLGEIA
jgi:voltage-gated sodium channel